MGIIDFQAKFIDTIKAKIKKLNIGFNKEEKKIIINAEDKSINTFYHNEIGLSNEDILKLPSEDIGNFIKHRAILNIKAAFKNRPEEMRKYSAIYSGTALTIGASLVTATADITSIKIPMASGDFVRELPKAIEAIKIDEKINLEIVRDQDRQNGI